MNKTTDAQNVEPQVIGLLPAGGEAARISPLPCSKELFPVGFRTVREGGISRPKVACHYLLEKMSSAGISQAYVVLRSGKWDIPAYLGDGSLVKMHLAYLMMGVPFGTPYTLDQAYPFVRTAVVAFGFPDIIFQGDDAFVQLLNRLTTTQADVVLGLFPVDMPKTMDMVEIDSDSQVCSIVIQPVETKLLYGWIIAVWTPVFTEFLHGYLSTIQIEKQGSTPKDVNGKDQPELSVGHVFEAALYHGLKLQSVTFPNHAYIDIGTPGNLFKAVHDRTFHEPAPQSKDNISN